MTPITEAIEVLERVWSETNDRCISFLESYELSRETAYFNEYERAKAERRVLTRAIENLKEAHGNSQS